MHLAELKVLIVDDEPELRKSVALILTHSLPDCAFSVSEADTGQAAVEKCRGETFDFILMDVRMPEMDGLTALGEIKNISPQTFVMIMTAHSNLQDAVTAIKSGAYDYIEKPVQPEKLVKMIRDAMNAREMVSSLTVSRPILDDDVESEFVGSGRRMEAVYDLIHRLSHVETTVLIRGENGTGKELVARAIHANSPRKHGEFIAVNCGAVPENLMESEFFGHERGAFTGAIERKIGRFQLANKGTIFLDEIGELKPEMQVKLLRVLQEKKFVPVGGTREIATTARVIAATNRNLEKMIEDGDFREDLFYRLNVMPIFMPPLRDRIEDMEELVDYFIRRFNRHHQRQISAISPDALFALKHYRWPGNIRELENIIERAFIVSNSNILQIDALPEHVREAQSTQTEISLGRGFTGPLDFDRFKEMTEKEFIVQALKANNGRINQTVAHANIPKNTLLRKIKKYSINVKELGGTAED